MDVINDVLQEIKHSFSHANKEGVNYPVRLFTRSERLPFKITLKLAQCTAILAAVGGFMLYNTMGEFIGVTTIFLGCAFAVYLIVRRILPPRKLRFKEYEGTLTNFIIENNLYEEENGKLVKQIDMSYTVFPRILSVYVTLHGDCYENVAEKLAEPLQSALGLEFHKMQVVKGKENFVEYMFRLQPVERYTIGTTMPLEDTTATIEVYGEYGEDGKYDGLQLDLTKNCSTLIGGVSGAGKSYLVYYLVTRYLSKRINGSSPELYMLDPKQSDLYILCKQSNMPYLRYGHTNADAFRIVKDFKAKLDIRQAEYSEKARIGKTMIDLGAEPALLLIDEYASLVAGMSKQQRAEFDDMISIIAQKGRQLSMFVWLITQQPRSETIPTNIREQLVNKIFMGTPSPEASRMLFSSTDVPAVSGVGAGLYSIDGKAVKTFEAPRFEGDFEKLIMPVWECANLSKQQTMNIPGEEKKPTHEVDFSQFV